MNNQYQWKGFRQFVIDVLFFDHEKQRISHTKTISILAGLIITIMFPFAVVFGDKAGAELWLVFAGMAFGVRTLNNFISKRFKEK